MFIVLINTGSTLYEVFQWVVWCHIVACLWLSIACLVRDKCRYCKENKEELIWTVPVANCDACCFCSLYSLFYRETLKANNKLLAVLQGTKHNQKSGVTVKMHLKQCSFIIIFSSVLSYTAASNIYSYPMEGLYWNVQWWEVSRVKNYIIHAYIHTAVLYWLSIMGLFKDNILKPHAIFIQYKT